MPDYIRIHPAGGTWVARADGAVIAESRAALELAEGALAPVVYFPRADVAMALLEPSGRVTNCPRKGTTEYFHIAGPASRITDAAWSYPAPHAAAAGIAGHLAFDAALVTVERL